MAGSDGKTLKEVKRGDSEGLDITVTKIDSTPYNITNSLLVFEARYRYSDATPLLRKTSEFPAQIQKLDPANGRAIVNIDKEDLLVTTKTVTLSCTLSVIDANARPNTILFKLPVTYRPV